MINMTSEWVRIWKETFEAYLKVLFENWLGESGEAKVRIVIDLLRFEQVSPNYRPAVLPLH
jgi:hypothetical protein